MGHKFSSWSKKENILITLGIIFISFNLRAPITAVGSIADMIKLQYGLSGSALGFITTLPLIVFAVVSPFVARYSQKFGYGKSMLGGLFLIMVGELIRSYTNSIGLFVGTAFLGIGIAIGNVLIPSIIKVKFPSNIGLMSSVYVSSMTLFAAVGAGVSLPLAKGLSLGWRNSLALWVVLALFTVLIWIPQLKSQKNVAPITNNIAGSKYSSIWKSSTAWCVTLFMGIQSLLFYSLVAWLPTIIISKGMSDYFASDMAFIFQIAGIPSTLIVPILCDKFMKQRGLVMLVCFLYLSGMILFLFGESEVVILLATLLLSLGMGGTISLSIAFISLRSPNAKRTSELSGMAQSAGYLLASVGPIFMGLIYDNLGTWTLPIIMLCVLIIAIAFFGYFAGNNVLIEES